MKTYSLVQHEGENMGDIPEDYNFMDWWKNGNGLYPCNPEIVEKKGKSVLEIQKAIKEGKIVFIRESYDSLKYRVLEIGMYDGWPFWKPTPAIRRDDSAFGYGTPWVFWYQIYEYQVRESK